MQKVMPWPSLLPHTISPLAEEFVIQDPLMENQTLCESLDGGAELGAMDRKVHSLYLGSYEP